MAPLSSASFFAAIALLAPLLVASSLNASPLAASPLQWRDAIEIARGPGDKGPWQQNNSRYSYVDDPAVLIHVRGETSVAWVDQAQKGILFQRYSADGRAQLPQPVDVSRRPHTISWLPRLARTADAPDEIHVLWQEIIFSGGSHGGDMLYSRSIDGGASFSPPLNLSRSQAGDGKGRINAEVWDNGSYDLIAGPDGKIYAAWTEYEGRLQFSRSTDGGRHFSRPETLAGAGHSPAARAPALALGVDGTAYLAWSIGNPDRARIHVSRSTDEGRTFDPPAILAAGSRYADAPKLAVDTGGRLHLTYAQSEGGPFDRYRIHYTYSDDKARRFLPVRDISRPLPASAESARYPSLGVDAAGRVYVSYELYPDHRKAPRGLGISVSSDGGERFLPPADVPGSVDPGGGINGSQQGRLMNKLAVSHDGHVALVNSSLQHGAQSRIWMMRGIAGKP